MLSQNEDYLTGTCLYLSHLTSKKSPELTEPSQNPAVVTGNVMIDPTATVDPSASIGPNVVIGPNCVVGKGARLQRCVLLENSRVKDHAYIQSAIIGWNSTVGKWVSLATWQFCASSVSPVLNLVRSSCAP